MGMSWDEDAQGTKYLVFGATYFTYRSGLRLPQIAVLINGLIRLCKCIGRRLSSAPFLEQKVKFSRSVWKKAK